MCPRAKTKNKKKPGRNIAIKLDFLCLKGSVIFDRVRHKKSLQVKMYDSSTALPHTQGRAASKSHRVLIKGCPWKRRKCSPPVHSKQTPSSIFKGFWTGSSPARRLLPNANSSYLSDGNAHLASNKEIPCTWCSERYESRKVALLAAVFLSRRSQTGDLQV